MKQLLFLLILFLSTSSILFGQLEKGDWMLASDNNINIHFIANIHSSSKAGLMTSDRTMLGMNVGIDAAQTRDLAFFGQTFNYNFSFFMRRFFNKRGQFLPFFECEAGIEEHRNSNIFRTNNNEEILNIDIKLGALQFIAPNIALEAIIGTRAVQYDNTSGNISSINSNTGRIYANIGVKTFLKERFTKSQDIRSSYLRQGNYKISGRGFIQNINANEIGLFSQRNIPTFPEKKGIEFHFSPKIQYFKTDYWTLGGGVNLGFLATGAGHRIQAGVLFQSGIYLPLRNNIFFAPNIGISYNRTITNADALLPGVLPTSPLALTKIRNSFQTLSIPMDLKFRWFLSPKMIISLGGLFETSFTESRLFGGTTIVNGNFYTNFEYFFTPNIALQTTVTYTTRLNNVSFSSIDSGLISFGISYFIFK